MLGHKASFSQNEGDHNLIEVDDEWIWNIMKMRFEPTDKQKIGIYIICFCECFRNEIEFYYQE